MKQQDIVSQAALAAELNASRSTVSRLVARGMPHQANGRLDRLEALRWLANYTSGHAGGWTAGGRGKDGLGVRAQALLAGNPPAAPAPEPDAELVPEGTTLQRVSDLCRKAYRDGQLATANGLCRPENQLAIAETGLGLGLSLEQAITMARWYVALLVLWIFDEDEAHVLQQQTEPDWAALAARIGETVTPEEIKSWWKKAGRAIDKWYKAHPDVSNRSKSASQ